MKEPGNLPRPETITAFQKAGVEKAKRFPFRTRSSYQVQLGEDSDRRNGILHFYVGRRGMPFRRNIEQVAVVLYDGRPDGADPREKTEFFPYVEVYLIYSPDTYEPMILTSEGHATRKTRDRGLPKLPRHRFHRLASEEEAQSAITQMSEATKANRLWYYRNELLTDAEIREKRGIA